MDLFTPSFNAEPYSFSGDQLKEIAFPLGGIGTGCVSLDGRGGLRDWEIFGRPNKGSVFDTTFPALWYRVEGEEPKASVLLGPRRKDFAGSMAGFWTYGHGRFFEQMDGLPHCQDNSFLGTFPVARLNFVKGGCPLAIELAAFNPFILGDVAASSHPVACLVYRVCNLSDRRVEGSIAWSMLNPVGEGQAAVDPGVDRSTQAVVTDRCMTGIRFSNEQYSGDHLGAGTFAVMTDWPHVSATARWKPEGWWDAVRAFWNQFRTTGTLLPSEASEPGQRMPGSLALHFDLAPGESADLPFVFSWVFPNAEKYWQAQKEGETRPTWRHHYATVDADAWTAGARFLKDRASLTERTLQFEHALYDSTLPPEILLSVGASLSTLHSPTVTRLEDGTFSAWEGCSQKEGCCEGTCSHVWNYALAHAYLFPEIQRNMLDTAFQNGFLCGPEGQKGAMNFRQMIPLGTNFPLWHAASDGQLGQIIQVVRDWRLSGDTDWLRQIWPSVQLAMRYSWVQWDRDADGLVDGDMHNTYDINFQTPNPLTQFFYLGALRACETIASALGEDGTRYRDLYERGRDLTEQRLWNGQFFYQEGDFTSPEDARYQHGKGCLSDQVFGQLCSTIAGLGDLVDPRLITTSLRSIYELNFRSPLGDHENLQRVYAFADEPGLILCSWPEGGQPFYPFVYSDEVWTGIEYQVATHLAYAGLRDEALEVVKGIRKRYDGTRRNPFNEFECGSHYARALASYGLMLAWTGIHVDRIADQVTFGALPFRSLIAAPGGWGIAQRLPDGTGSIEVIEGFFPQVGS
ncbi:MAG: GH116 family glycosyl-hydrolase [Fimbriimonas sp.]